VPGFVSKAPIAKVEEKVLEALGKVPGKWTPGREIHQMVSGRIKGQDLRQSLGALVELGRIEVGESPTSKKPVYRIC
jgi:hypothetical protein